MRSLKNICKTQGLLFLFCHSKFQNPVISVPGKITHNCLYFSYRFVKCVKPTDKLLGCLPIMPVKAREKAGTKKDNQGLAGLSREKEGTNRDKAATNEGQTRTSRASPCLYLLVPVCPCRSQSIRSCHCLSLSIPFCPCLSLSIPFCPCLSLSFPVCPCLTCLSLSLHVFPCLSLSVKGQPCLSLYF